VQQSSSAEQLQPSAAGGSPPLASWLSHNRTSAHAFSRVLPCTLAASCTSPPDVIVTTEFLGFCICTAAPGARHVLYLRTTRCEKQPTASSICHRARRGRGASIGPPAHRTQPRHASGQSSLVRHVVAGARQIGRSQEWGGHGARVWCRRRVASPCGRRDRQEKASYALRKGTGEPCPGLPLAGPGVAYLAGIDVGARGFLWAATATARGWEGTRPRYLSTGRTASPRIAHRPAWADSSLQKRALVVVDWWCNTAPVLCYVTASTLNRPMQPCTAWPGVSSSQRRRNEMMERLGACHCHVL
jgi:hypothetical protein